LRKLHECHERSILVIGRASRAGPPKPATRGRQGQACVPKP
jgi:hypothetical protein